MTELLKEKLEENMKKGRLGKAWDFIVIGHDFSVALGWI